MKRNSRNAAVLSLLVIAFAVAAFAFFPARVFAGSKTITMIELSGVTLDIKPGDPVKATGKSANPLCEISQEAGERWVEQSLKKNLKPDIATGKMYDSAPGWPKQFDHFSEGKVYTYHVIVDITDEAFDAGYRFGPEGKMKVKINGKMADPIGCYEWPLTYKGSFVSDKRMEVRFVKEIWLTSVAPTAMRELETAKKGFRVHWAKCSKDADGYEIQYSTKKNFANAASVLVKNKNKDNKKINGLKRNKKYYVRIRSFKKWKPYKANYRNRKEESVKGYVYSKWSSVREVKTKK